jgi:hypothetical protein
MAKQEQVLIIEPQHELKFRGKLRNSWMILPPIYLYDLAKPVASLGTDPEVCSSISRLVDNGLVFVKIGSVLGSQALIYGD